MSQISVEKFLAVANASYSHIVISIEDEMSSFGYRPVKSEEIQPGVEIIRVEMQRFYCRKHHGFQVGSSGVYKCEILNVEPNTRTVEICVHWHTPDITWEDAENILRHGGSRTPRKNDIRYYVKDAGSHCV